MGYLPFPKTNPSSSMMTFALTVYSFSLPLSNILFTTPCPNNELWLLSTLVALESIIHVSHAIRSNDHYPIPQPCAIDPTTFKLCPSSVATLSN